MQLTNDQQAASAAFTHFMITDEKEMVLSGGAGVGKTTLLKHLMQLKDPALICKLAGIEPIDEWHLTATTNKAAEVLANSTNFPTSTIHSFLNLVVFNDFETGKTKIKKTKKFGIKKNALIVVDEASMIDWQLRKIIDEATVNCKILYVGDHCQLAPVGEETSSVFVDVPNRSYLNQIIRSQGCPPITKLALQLRETVETGVFKPIEEVPGAIEFLDPAQAEAKILEYFVQQPQLGAEARILAFTNNKVVGFNNYIRQARGLPEELVVGDTVIACNAAYLDGSNQRLRIEQEVDVLHVPTSTRMFPLNGVKDFEVRDIETTAGRITVPVNRHHWQALIKHFKKMADWMTFYALQEQIADVRPREACTVHKSQGSTYRVAFVDLGDIGTCRISSQTARMLYVACSRPTDRIYFIGNLPPKYRGG